METMEKSNLKLYQFRADFCNPCKQQTKEFEENPIEVPLEAIDIDDDENNLTTEYKVMSIPTMVLLNKDEVINKWVGFTKSDVINEYIRGLTISNKGE